MSQATYWIKKSKKKNFKFFSFFIGGTLMIFLKKSHKESSWKIIRVPPMKSEKNMKFFSSIFLSKIWPKMPVRIFFEKSLTNFECVLFVRPRILNTSPFLDTFPHYSRFYCTYVPVLDAVVVVLLLLGGWFVQETLDIAVLWSAVFPISFPEKLVGKRLMRRP